MLTVDIITLLFKNAVVSKDGFNSMIQLLESLISKIYMMRHSEVKQVGLKVNKK